MSESIHPGSPQEGPDPGSAGGIATAFGLHLVAWFLFYLTVVIAWGQRNSWPAELLICVLSVPLTTLVASTLFKMDGFGFAIEPENSQQEQLIAALVLSVGLASGQVLLMAIGLVGLGIAWFRPAAPRVDWAEWLKIPLLFLTTLPFWLDFEGSRLPLAGLFDDPTANPVFSFPLALSTTQARFLGYCGLLAMALFLRGRAFWLALPCLPVFLVVVTGIPKWVPEWREQDPVFRAAFPWLLGIAFLTLGVQLVKPAENASRAFVPGETLRRWFEQRRYPPWVAVLVVAVTQALPFETVRFSLSEVLGLLGLGGLSLVLFRLRLRTPRGPIHSRSVAMVAGGLALTLGAEFATNESLRHVALAFVIIGLVSWHCFWPLRIFVVAGLAGIALLMAPGPLPTGVWNSQALTGIRLLAGFSCLGALLWLTRRPLPRAGAKGYSEDGWVPPKRFALILLGLMMLFQTASAFWPEHEIDLSGIATAHEELEDSPDILMGGEPGWSRLPSPKGPVQMMIAYPRKNPYLLQSPERTLRRGGWQVVERVRAAHPWGEAMTVKLEREGRTATAMWWFELGESAFSNHLYARRVLWSGWHLADRRLRLVRLESTAIDEPEDLIEVARREHWFMSARQVQLARR